MKSSGLGIAVVCMAVHAAWAGPSFVNWEHAHVHPLDMTPDGAKLLAVNTADNRLEVFDLAGGMPTWSGSVAVGLDPVSVRARSGTEAWVVNILSDSVSVIDLTTMNVVATILTLDEPADVVFAGQPQRAFVSCSQANTLQVFDPADRHAAPVNVPIDAEDPRALAVSPDGATVYAAIFESGNGTTLMGGGTEGGEQNFPLNAVNDPLGPYGGVNPPPNAGNVFNPPINPALPPPPPVALIVRKDDEGRWMDDNQGDWTEMVSGSLSSHSSRLPGWDLPDRDVAVIDAAGLQVSYATRLMNVCMAMAVNPADGQVTMVGTDATNEIRFQPVVQGRFTRVRFARFGPSIAPAVVSDLNPHLTYEVATIPQSERDKSIGDPRGIVWQSDGARGYVSGMGSNNVVVIDGAGGRAGLAPTIEVGEGPTGLVLDEARSRLYVLNRFAATISVVSTAAETELAQLPFFDPTPEVIRVGRRHLFDTHETSGLGQLACASCHVDARTDRLAWDLGDPTGEMKAFHQNCNFGLDLDIPCEDYHPMKGPMLTQTLQDVIGKEPLHWRGDRDGLEEFNPAFRVLMGDDEELTPAELQQLKAYLATITFPPNPFRNLDNTLKTDLPLPGHFTTGRFGTPGLPMPNGNPARGLTLYRTGGLGPAGLQCASCHTLPTGSGTNYHLTEQGTIEMFPLGPNGEHHQAIISITGSTNVSMKAPQLRNAYDRVGLDLTQVTSNAGFGYLHDGAVDSIARMIDVFGVKNLQELADVTAFVVSLSGSDLPVGNTYDAGELRGPDSQDTHAAVGAQVTFSGPGAHDGPAADRLSLLRSIADSGAVGLIAKGVLNGEHRGFFYVPPATMQSDRAGEQVTIDDLRLAAGRRAEITFTVVPAGAEGRIGVDRDEDGFFDRDELDACSDPADPLSTPANAAGCPPLGSCCLPGGECVDHVAESVCLGAGGVYGGDGQRCVDVVCAIRRGACCFGPGACVGDAREADCANAGGAYQGDGSTCAVPACGSTCGQHFADADRDGDVDMSDFAAFQACMTGADDPQGIFDGVLCGCFDRGGDQPADGDIDASDLSVFVNCLSGEAIAPPPECGNGP